MKICIYWDILGTLYSTVCKWRDNSFVLFRLLKLASFVVIWKFWYFSDMRKGKLSFVFMRDVLLHLLVSTYLSANQLEGIEIN